MEDAASLTPPRKFQDSKVDNNNQYMMESNYI